MIRNVLFQALNKRVITEEEKQDLIFNDQVIHTEKKIAQGGHISLQLFNIYLEEALLSNPHLLELLEQKALQAFADDLEVTTSNPQQLD